MSTHRTPPTPFTELVYAWSGRLTGWLLCAMVIFSPWAFGTTQRWSIAVMNAAGWLLAVCFVVRRLFLAPGRNRWQAERSGPVLLMGLLTLLLLAYVLISSWNAAAVYVAREWRLEERPHLTWLPHSFDAVSSWRLFWSAPALAGVFWAAYDWLRESRRGSPRAEQDVLLPRISSRLRLLLWVLAINGALVALEAILQRTSGTAKLLWLVPTHDNKEASAQLGPYAYRANGAQFLNLVWPVALAFWWWLHHDRSQAVTRRGLHHVLLPCVLVTAAASLFSLSRGGVGVACLLLLAVAAILAFRREASPALRWAVAVLVVLTAAGGFYMSWSSLGRRLAETAHDPLSGRRETYELAQQMARDYPWFGTGPGTFDPLFQIYRQNPEQYWPAQLHNDWLELRITFGRIGFGLILCSVAVACLRWLLPGGARRETSFLMIVTITLAGCLLHARYDFPFQVYSLQFLFLLLAAILFSSSRGRSQA